MVPLPAHFYSSETANPTGKHLSLCLKFKKYNKKEWLVKNVRLFGGIPARTDAKCDRSTDSNLSRGNFIWDQDDLQNESGVQTFQIVSGKWRMLWWCFWVLCHWEISISIITWDNWELGKAICQQIWGCHFQAASWAASKTEWPTGKRKGFCPSTLVKPHLELCSALRLPKKDLDQCREVIKMTGGWSTSVLETGWELGLVSLEKRRFWVLSFIFFFCQGQD